MRLIGHEHEHEHEHEGKASRSSRPFRKRRLSPSGPRVKSKCVGRQTPCPSDESPRETRRWEGKHETDPSQVPTGNRDLRRFVNLTYTQLLPFVLSFFFLSLATNRV